MTLLETCGVGVATLFVLGGAVTAMVGNRLLHTTKPPTGFRNIKVGDVALMFVLGSQLFEREVTAVSASGRWIKVVGGDWVPATEVIDIVYRILAV